MVNHFTHYVSSLVFLVALTVVYQNVVTPWMKPPRITPVAAKNPARLRADNSLNDLFAEGSWQRGPCKRLQTAEGVLLFEHEEQTADDQWKLWPITVVIGRGLSSKASDTPVILEAESGAEIKFTDSLDVMSGGAPPIERGRMIGKVHIYRVGGEDVDRSLDLKTSNVGIDNRKVWTTETIEMQVGRAHLVGRDLTMHLSGSATKSNSGPILDRMELIYLDKLVMPLQRGDRRSTISLECGGRVEYDFALDELLLRDSVALIHEGPTNLIDRFDCETLELKLNDPTNDAIARQTPLDWLVTIVATGKPASAELQSYDAEIAADLIDFSARDGMLRASGERGIQLRRGGMSARLAKLEYQFDPKSPKVLGRIDAIGAGIVTIDEPNVPVRKAQWLDGFRLWPVGISTAKQMTSDFELWIDGKVHAWLVDGGEFKADSINGVLKPETKAGPAADSEKVSLVPDRFEIQGNVRIDTTAIAAETEQLRLYFVDGRDPRPVDTDRGIATSPLRQWVTQPSKKGQLVDPISRARPTIRGDSINAQLRRNSAGLSARKLSVVGGVEVTHMLETGGQMLPAKLTGEELQLIDSEGEDVLQLGSGAHSPARFELGDGFFVGPQIQVRPSDNMVWINAAGEFQIPTAALPTGLDGNKSSVTWTKPPHCRWQGEMLFDGRRAILSDGVDINATLVSNREFWELKLSGDRLQVDLLEPVQMSDMKAMRGATIQKITMLQAANRPVIATALHRAPDGVLEAKHMVHARKLTMIPSAGGRLIGDGPGSYRGWMQPNDESILGQPAAATSAADATLVDRAERELTGIHLVFNHSMQADLTSRNLDFLRGVRVGVRTVRTWDEAFDAGKMDAISMGDSTLDCDRLRFTVDPTYNAGTRLVGVPTPWEMEATSGIVFRTRNERGLLEVTASRASYASLKDRFIVQGAETAPALFRQTRPDGQPGPEGAVRSITIRPRTMQIENAQFQRLNIGAMPQPGSRAQ